MEKTRKANVIIYNIDNEYLKKVDNLLQNKLYEWFRINNLDINITIFTIGGLGRLQIDCEFEPNVDIDTVANVTNIFLNNFNIDYTYEFCYLN